ncbi:unnamed protein product [Cladocopium goreaui]|uniref:Nucleolin n=1 Tax=Cladocopium goreaui TaxID=2562237 RepID=A0A9P1BIE2_9DINO|nr:unnamed protein product [Cladocopium goreaui]
MLGRPEEQKQRKQDKAAAGKTKKRKAGQIPCQRANIRWVAAAGKAKKRKAGQIPCQRANIRWVAAAGKAKKRKAGQIPCQWANIRWVAAAGKAKKRKAGAEATEASASKPEAAAGKAKKRKAGAEATEATASKPEAETWHGTSGSKKSKAQVDSAKDAATGADRTVFVDGVPYDWTLERIKEFFATKCGGIVEVRAPTWQDSGRLRGYAHVAFSDAESMKKALHLNGTKVGKKGRYLKIDPAKKPEGQGGGKSVTKEEIEGKRRLFVKNLPYDASEDDIAKLFAKCGKVVEIRIPHASGRSKGFAYVEFAKAQGLKAAMDLEPVPSLQGRKLHLDADSGTGPKAGFHHRPDAFQSKFVAKAKQPKGKGKGRPSLF